MYKHRTVAIISLLLILFILPIATPQKAESAKFILSSWSYPDEYGQGIEFVTVYQNVSGSWELLSDGNIIPTASTAFEINETITGIKIRVRCWLNNTMVGASDITDSKKYIRHNATLFLAGGIDPVYSLENFTFETGGSGYYPMYWYDYNGTIPFDFASGMTYILYVNCEIYHELIGEESTVAVTGSYEGTSSDGDYTDTFIKDDSWYSAYDTTPLFSESVIYLNFSLNEPVTSLNLSSYCISSVQGNIEAWNSTDWEKFGTILTSENWINVSISADCVIDGVLFLRWRVLNPTAPSLVKVDLARIDYVYVSESFEWREVAEIVFYFSVSISQEALWALNNWYILLGAGLVIGSGVYLVKGGRSELSSDKFFYVMIAFMIGWALIIGGVMP